MRLSEITTEQDPTKLVEFVKANCQPWLQAVGGRVFYRGTKKTEPFKLNDDSINDYSKMEMVIPRTPRDSSLAATEVFNDAIELAGGIANRTNSRFITSIYNIASSYVGTNSEYVYVAMPVGPFNYTWSEELIDWFADAIQMNKILNYVDRAMVNRFLKDKYPDIYKIISVDYDSAKYSHKTPVGSYYIDVYYYDENKNREKRNALISITYDRIVLSALAKDIQVDVGLKQAWDIGSEVMIKPQSGQLLLINSYYYHKVVEKLL